MKILFEIHPITYVSLLIAFLTGYFKDTILFMSIILIHEIGHISAALIFKWKLERIVILPFGGITIFNEILNKPLIEEFIITIMGPLFQIIFTVLMKDTLVMFYSKVILFINLIPIYPLDGSKLLNIFFNKITSFKKSHILTIYISYVLGFIFLIFMFLKKEFIYLISILLIIIKLKKELKNHKYIFNKFLYERYLYDLKFKKVKIVSKLEKFKKDYYHYLNINQNIVDEKNFLKNKFKN